MYNSELETIEIYKSILRGTTNRFPYEFWQGEDARYRAIVCIKYLFFEHLKLSREEILQGNPRKLIHDNYLNSVFMFIETDIYSILKLVFDDITIKDVSSSLYYKKTTDTHRKTLSDIDLEDMDVLDVYKLMLDGKLCKSPKEYMTKDRVKICLKYLFEDLLKFTREDICTKITKGLLRDYKLESLVIVHWHNDIIGMITELYPDIAPGEIIYFKNITKLSDNHKKIINSIEPSNADPIEIYKLVLSKQLDKFPRNFWTEDNIKKCVLYLIHEIKGWTNEDALSKLTIKDIEDNCLSGILHVTGKKTHDVFNYVFGETSKWELRQVPNRTFNNREETKQYLRYLFEETLKWSKEDIINKFTNKTLKDNKLTGCLKHALNGNSVRAIIIAYPDEIQPYELKNKFIIPEDWFDEIEHLNNYMKYHINKYGLSYEDIKKNISGRFVLKYHLLPERVFKSKFDLSPEKLLKHIEEAKLI